MSTLISDILKLLDTAYSTSFPSVKYLGKPQPTLVHFARQENVEQEVGTSKAGIFYASLRPLLADMQESAAFCPPECEAALVSEHATRVSYLLSTLRVRYDGVDEVQDMITRLEEELRPIEADEDAEVEASVLLNTRYDPVTI